MKNIVLACDELNSILMGCTQYRVVCPTNIQVNVDGVYYWYQADGTQLDATALSFSELSADHKDMFAVESFIDGSGNHVYIVYGYGWKGTFAGGKFFKFIMYTNISSYIGSYYVFEWTDGNGDGFVDLDEISVTPIAQG